jgi:hypothetical protein
MFLSFRRRGIAKADLPNAELEPRTMDSEHGHRSDEAGQRTEVSREGACSTVTGVAIPDNN